MLTLVRLNKAIVRASISSSDNSKVGIFSVLNALILRSLPFRNAERLVEVKRSPVSIGGGRAKFYDWRDHNKALEDVTGFLVNEMNLTLSREPARVKVAETPANFFGTLGVEPELGRAFAADEDIEGRGPVAILGHALWEQAFGADPHVLV